MFFFYCKMFMYDYICDLFNIFKLVNYSEFYFWKQGFKLLCLMIITHFHSQFIANFIPVIL